jgi:hypothetical protein
MKIITKNTTFKPLRASSRRKHYVNGILLSAIRFFFKIIIISRKKDKNDFILLYHQKMMVTAAFLPSVATVNNSKRIVESLDTAIGSASYQEEGHWNYKSIGVNDCKFGPYKERSCSRIAKRPDDLAPDCVF